MKRSDQKHKIYGATIRVVLEITTEGHWGEDCTIAQIEKQAAAEGKAALLKALTVVSKPKVLECKVQNVSIACNR